MPPTVKGMGKITLHKPKLNYRHVTLFATGGNLKFEELINLWPSILASNTEWRHLSRQFRICTYWFLAERKKTEYPGKNLSDQQQQWWKASSFTSSLSLLPLHKNNCDSLNVDIPSEV